ncbi:hypothetical protein M9458_024674, partial [Cirrhinus mrigala]
MAENWKNCLEEELICPICLNVFSEPVQLPCKHNFCRMCINEAWSKDTGMVRCPECNHAYSQKPALEKNHKLSNIVEKRRRRFCIAFCAGAAHRFKPKRFASGAMRLVAILTYKPISNNLLPTLDTYCLELLYHCETEHVAVCQYCCFSRCATNHGHAVCDIEVRRNDIR